MSFNAISKNKILAKICGFTVVVSQDSWADPEGGGEHGANCLLRGKLSILMKGVLLSTHNICFDLEIRELVFKYAFISGCLLYE